MNYAEVSRLLIIIFITCFILISLVVYILLEFIYRWKKIGIRKTGFRILAAILSGILLTLLYYFILLST